MRSVPRHLGSPKAKTTSPLWVSGRFVLRAHGVGSNWWREVTIRRPHALIGRLAGADLRIDDPEVEDRHVYLHLDRRGLFAVDLASRTGSRIGPRGQAAGWLVPGDALEVAGRRIELVGLELDDPDTQEPAGGDPLGDSDDRARVRLALFPEQGAGAPLVLNSELVFVGRSAACGVRIEGEAAAMVHGVLVRGEHSAYVVNLLGRESWLNGRPLREASLLQDGDILALGATRFECRIQPAGSEAGFPALRPGAPAPAPVPTSAAPQTQVQAQASADLLAVANLPAPPPVLGDLDQQGQVLAWMLSVIQATQGEMLRRQATFQEGIVEALGELRAENAEALNQHLERLDGLRGELARVRKEVRERFGSSTRPRRPPLPQASPLALSTPPKTTEDPEAAAAWLLDRVGQIDRENRNSWRDLLGRLSRDGK